MSRLIEISQKLNAWVQNIESNIDNAIYKFEQEIVELNRNQLNNNLGFDDKPLVNERTGSEYLSKQYAKRTGKRKPDLFVNGNFQDEMRLTTKYSAKKYSVFSYHRLEKYLSVQYKNYPGISKTNQQEAQSITNHAIGTSIKQATGLT